MSIRLHPAISGVSTLQGYFEHQAGKYGTTVDQIYKATAANSDLKRLPTEDEVASAILFMASDMSSGITGQTLDVNCGEYNLMRAEDEQRESKQYDSHRRRYRRRAACLGRPSWSGLTISAIDDDNYREALQVLLDSYRRDAGLTVLGSKMKRFFLRGALVARLLSEAAWKQYPQHADVTIERPIFVTGLARTGTTALHRLLGARPGHQGLQLWLAEFPQPRPPRETWGQTRFIANSTRSSPSITRRTPTTPGCTSWPPTRWRSAGSCCASRCIRCPTRPWRICPATRVAGASRTGRRVSAAPQEPSADRAERRRASVGC